MFTELDHKKKQLDQKRPFPEHTIRTLREHLLLEWTYHSNAIEGNTLTLSETKVVLEGITIGGKLLREHLEVINHQEAIYYLEEIVRNQEPFSEWQIKNIHRLVLKGISDHDAGVYRLQNVLISGAKHIPPDYIKLPSEMERLIEWYDGAGALHPVERAARLHVEFVKIHPFVDGNGRTSRLLMNLELMKHGFPPTIIRKENRLDYYQALDVAHTTGKYEAFFGLIVKAIQESLNLYMKMIL